MPPGRPKTRETTFVKSFRFEKKLADRIKSEAARRAISENKLMELCIARALPYYEDMVID